MKAYVRLSLAALLVASAAVSSAVAADRKVTVHNATSQTLTEFYASNTGTDDWEEDILGKQELAPGEEIEVDIDDGTGKCKFDFQGVFEDGDKVVKTGINVCQVGTFTFTE